MRRTTIKLIATILTVILCMGCFTACRNNKDINETSNTESSFNEEVVDETEQAETTGTEQTEATESIATSTTDPITCSHDSTTVKNKKSATCTANGYTGDTYCKKCGKKLSSGSTVPATGHETELRNIKKRY